MVVNRKLTMPGGAFVEEHWTETRFVVGFKN